MQWWPLRRKRRELGTAWFYDRLDGRSFGLSAVCVNEWPLELRVCVRVESGDGKVSMWDYDRFLLIWLN